MSKEEKAAIIGYWRMCQSIVPIVWLTEFSYEEIEKVIAEHLEEIIHHQIN